MSSAEAEYVALSEAAKEMRFVAQLLESMEIEVQKPIVVRVDNIGASFMAENVSTSQRTKHVDVRYKFVNEFIFENFLKIIFVKSEKNKSDIFTKNTKSEVNEEQVMEMIREVEK